MDANYKAIKQECGAIWGVMSNSYDASMQSINLTIDVGFEQ